MTLDEFFTYADSVEERLEFVDGQPIVMEAPTNEHQDIVDYFTNTLKDYFKPVGCKVYYGRIVKLFKDRDDLRIPDSFVPSNQLKIKSRWIEDAPSLVLEVWSKNNFQLERFKKLSKYFEAGVKEVITVDYLKDKVLVYDYLHNYLEFEYSFKDKINSYVFDGLSYCLEDFTDILCRYTK